jgi:hypothetical protein
MSRQCATTARPWLLRWLLVAAALAGLGIWQGGHCAGDIPAELGVHRGSASGTLVDHAAPQPLTAVPYRHADEPSQSRRDGPGKTAGTCRDLPATMTSTAVVIALPQPDGVRTAVVIPRIPPIVNRPLSGVALTDIGISRT